MNKEEKLQEEISRMPFPLAIVFQAAITKYRIREDVKKILKLRKRAELRKGEMIVPPTKSFYEIIGEFKMEGK